MPLRAKGRYARPDSKTKREQNAEAVDSLLGGVSDRLFKELRDGLTNGSFAELRQKIAALQTGRTDNGRDNEP